MDLFFKIAKPSTTLKVVCILFRAKRLMVAVIFRKKLQFMTILNSLLQIMIIIMTFGSFLVLMIKPIKFLFLTATEKLLKSLKTLKTDGMVPITENHYPPLITGSGLHLKTVSLKQGILL